MAGVTGGGPPAEGGAGPAGSDSWPSYEPADPTWVTDDFASLDLGTDPTESAPRSVRRLDLPPLSQLEGEQASAPGGGPDSRVVNDVPNGHGPDRQPAPPITDPGPSAPGESVKAGVVSHGRVPERRAVDAVAGSSVSEPSKPLDEAPADVGAPETNDLGVFGANAGDATAVFASSDGPDADRMGGQQPSGPSYSPTTGAAMSSAPKQGAPPHPLSGAGGAPARGRSERGQLHPVAPTGGGGFEDPGFGQPGRGDGFGGARDEGFGVGDNWSDDPSAGQHFDGRRPRTQLELAPPIEVEEQRRRWVLPVAGLLAVAALAAGYFLFIRDDGGDADQFAVDTDTTGDLVEEDLEEDPATAGTDDAMGDGTDGAPAVLSDSPVLTLQGADEGPLLTETQYELQIEGVPANSEYLVIVDDIPQEPALDYLPLLILPEGRHSIAVEVQSGADSAATNAVDVYVLAPQLTKTYRANLSSVSMTDEGWGEAIRQFDEFRAAGHDGLVLSPSDPYPSLLPGFWNLYVGGFADHAEAQAYCEQSGLIIPDECFPAPFDPDGPPRDG